MSALSISSVTAAAVSDGTRQIPAVGVLGADGTLFQPAQATAATCGFQRITDGTNNLSLVNTTDLPVAVRASATGGATPYKFIGAAGSNQDSTVVKASAGTLYTLSFTAVVGSVRYLKIYDKATGPTSADTPVHTIMVPASVGATVSLPLPACGEVYAAGISFRMTTGLADSDANAVTANDCLTNLSYK